MKTAAQIANAAKVRLQQDLIFKLRGRKIFMIHDTWDDIIRNKMLWAEMQSYDLAAPDRRAKLSKVAFPDANHSEVDAALMAGNNLEALYSLALGNSHIPKDTSGNYVRGKRGLRIIKGAAV